MQRFGLSHASGCASPARMSAAGVKSQIELSLPTAAVCDAVQKRSSWIRVAAVRKRYCHRSVACTHAATGHMMTPDD
jgi:hypothetical protein